MSRHMLSLVLSFPIGKVITPIWQWKPEVFPKDCCHHKLCALKETKFSIGHSELEDDITMNLCTLIYNLMNNYFNSVHIQNVPLDVVKVNKFSTQKHTT